ncbi:threonine ammonia-lyase [Pseudonocardia xishanensis]|uniref:L-threonine dehydratase catabolic TdcB n=1 Tax=Pseudonocardia xishanensis TaxID=630995 RepID=A0ABP8S3I9_9PSEU
MTPDVVRVSPPVGVADILAARELLAGVTRTTPVARSRALSEAVGGPVWFKCENLQRTGSFKIRGAFTRLSGLTAEERAHGVVAASAGNHAQGVALAARLLGIEATVFMPTGAALPKVDATRGYGAAVRLAGETVDEALAAALDHSAHTGAVLIHPFDHPAVVAGQGTVGLEIIDQVPDVATVLVATGGGGLLGGVAAAVKDRRPAARVVGVQAAGAAAWPASLAAGEPLPLGAMRTIADGIAVGRPGDVTFRQVEALVDGFVTVGEESLSRALLFSLERAKMLVEPAGVAPVAALLDDPGRFEPPVVAVLSGGNVDPLVLLHVIQNGMASAARYLSLQVRVGDRPGALAALLTGVGELGANVIDVEHTRISATVPMGEVDVALSMEMRGPEHCRELVVALRAAGHQVTVTGVPEGDPRLGG